MRKNALFASAFMMMAAAGAVKAQTISPSTEEGKYLIKAGDVTMTVNAGEGGKVISYKLGDNEMLSQLRMQNQYGSTFWTAPQAEWNWPPVTEFDRAAYEANLEGNVLTLTSKQAKKLPFIIEKKFMPAKNGKLIRVEYTIKNMGEEARKVAPWEISRVISDETGLIFFDSPVEQIEAAQGELIPFKGEAGASWYNFEQTRANRKINSDGKGWLGYAANGMLMIKKFADITPADPAPGEAEIQVYVNAGKTYIELESQGAYKEVAAGSSLTWTVDWYLLPLDQAKAVPSKALLKTAGKTIKASKKAKF